MFDDGGEVSDKPMKQPDGGKGLIQKRASLKAVAAQMGGKRFFAYLVKFIPTHCGYGFSDQQATTAAATA